MAVTILFVVSHPVQAEFIGSVLTVEATSSAGTASQSWNLPSEPSDRLVWSLDGKYDLLGAQGLIGSINQAVVTLEGDPAVGLSFAVSAGNADTTFTITTASVSFPGLTGATGFASAGVTLTDRDSLPGNGASLALTKTNTGLYQATYNSGTTFSELLGALSIASKGTISANANSGFQTIVGTVTDIQASYSFTLSKNDSASGTSQFEVVPEPSVFAMMIFGLISLVLARRRR
ncbi:MAG: PEP-CTERM sorting domain-containing protein [Planctomycetia bacterium]|nr:PEP-CTERM sorting domain-containing protein [Planctomycetia bacterium]